MAGFNVNSKKFGKLLEQNGFELNRICGSHYIYKHRNNGATISVPNRLNPIIAERLVRQFSLSVKK